MPSRSSTNIAVSACILPCKTAKCGVGPEHLHCTATTMHASQEGPECTFSPKTEDQSKAILEASLHADWSDRTTEAQVRCHPQSQEPRGSPATSLRKKPAEWSPRPPALTARLLTTSPTGDHILPSAQQKKRPECGCADSAVGQSQTKRGSRGHALQQHTPTTPSSLSSRSSTVGRSSSKGYGSPG